MIRRLLAVVPAVVLVGCGPVTVESGHAAPVRNEVVAAPVVTSPPTTEPAAPSVAHAVATKRAVQARGAPPKPAAAASSGCNINYTPCVPDDPVDVDCEGGSGNGPSYVKGPVWVIGEDIYGLDADGNGIGCEAGVARSRAAAPQAVVPQTVVPQTPPPPTEAPFTSRAAPPSIAPPPAKPTSPPTSSRAASESASSAPFRESS